MPNSARLIEAIMSVRGEATQSWPEFLAALQDYSEQVTADMVRCQPDMLVRAQGMAIMAAELAGVTKDAPKLYEKMLIAKMGKKTNV